jgi:hypothetical protein
MIQCLHAKLLVCELLLAVDHHLCLNRTAWGSRREYFILVFPPPTLQLFSLCMQNFRRMWDPVMRSCGHASLESSGMLQTPMMINQSINQLGSIDQVLI